MFSADWVDQDNAALFTDLYELTMLQAYHREGMNDEAVFDLFIRSLGERNYLITCGLDTVLEYVEGLRFTPESLEYLASIEKFDREFLDYLSSYRFSGDVYAVPEGTPVFAEEPLIQVVAPIGEAQLIETFLLNQVTFQTNAATKASRVRHAAGNRLVADFGMRRMHGADAAMKGVRAFRIAGLDSTSNVLAGKVYDVPVTGTMAHSYIEAHDREEDAFRIFSDVYPESVLLVDTYDTLEGVRKVVELAECKGAAFKVSAIRLDSGDLAELAVASRKILDDAGLDDVRIFASGGLDEYAIYELVERGAPIDGFGVGTRLGTISDQPYLDSVYKLSGYAGQPRMKLSAEKSNLPGRKQIFRQYEGEQAVRDIIAVDDEYVDGKPLMEPVMLGGERTDAGTHTLEQIREHAASALSELSSDLRSIDKRKPPYEVRLSERLRRRLEATRAQLESIHV